MPLPLPQLCASDVVYTVSLPHLLTEKLTECRAAHGPAYSSLVAATDIAVREQLLAFLPRDIGPTLLAISV